MRTETMTCDQCGAQARECDWWIHIGPVTTADMNTSLWRIDPADLCSTECAIAYLHDPDNTPHGPFSAKPTIDFDEKIMAPLLNERVADLWEFAARRFPSISLDSNTMSNEPCVGHMRIPVARIVLLAAQGYCHDDIVAECAGGISAEDVKQALCFAARLTWH